MATQREFIEQLMNRVQKAGIPVWRMYIGLQLVHPQLQAMGYMWCRGQPVEAVARAYGIQFTPAYIGSPMQKIPGTRMAFAGVRDAKEVEDLWSYLKQFGANGQKK